MDAALPSPAVVGPRFDESLASAARSLHLTEVAAIALAGACVLFVWLERRGRARWAETPRVVTAVGQGPYRASTYLVGSWKNAPLLVRVASFASLVFAHVFAPLIVLAVAKYPFDGIAIPLVPGLALVVLNWCCAWLLLGRSPLAEPAARTGAVGSLMGNVGLLVMAAAHFAAVELRRLEGVAHACSSSVTFVVIVFAIASILHALVLLAALRRHGEWLGEGGRSSATAAASPSAQP
jgi:hypothetical protein